MVIKRGSTGSRAGRLTGAITGFLMQVAIHMWALPINVGGRPLFSWPSFIPVTFDEMFFVTYFLMTGLHAVHLIVGNCVVVVTAIIAKRGGFLPPARHTPVEMVGLYWHFIDVIWTLLLQLLYLSGLHT